MNKYEETDYSVMTFGEGDRVDVRVYCGGTQEPQIHIIEKYPPRASDGVQEDGGRFVCAAKFVDDLQAEEFASRLSEALHAEGIINPYVDADSTRRSIQKASKDLDAQLRNDLRPMSPM